MKLIGFYNYTVILTYVGLVCGVLGMKFASEGRLGLAIIFLVIAGTCDMFDGVIARSKKDRTANEKSFGIQLDSLCDVICFGVFPAVYLYFSGVQTAVGIVILALYVLCAVIRLAFFNVLEGNRQLTEGGCAKGYRGLPVTTAAIIFPLFYLLGLLINNNEVMVIIYHILPAIVGFLFVLDFRLPKPDIGKLFQKKSKTNIQVEDFNNVE